MVLKFFNTLKRKLQSFKPIEAGKVKMYTCGPTVYNYPHIGNYRAYVFEDVLRRYLEYKGFQVIQVMNITDVDDKTIRDSQKEGVSLKEFCTRYENAFFEDLKTLNIERAEFYPRATEHVPEMVEIIKRLLQKKFAYKTDDGIYYSVSKFKKYGQLANIEVKELQAGASGRVKNDEYAKEEVQDFALWKFWTSEDGGVFWETDLGKGRPGWHIECSAMSWKLLGTYFDIHTGGVDNIFPHHQNEIAQSVPAFKTKFVNYWLHNEHLLVDGQKMSKSLGNFYTLRDVLAKGYEPKSIRYLLLSVHYRQKLNFTFDSLEAAKSAVQRLNDFVLRLESARAVQDNKRVSGLVKRLLRRFEKAMDADLEMSQALAAVFDFSSVVNSLLDKGKLSKNDAIIVIDAMRKVDKVLGVLSSREEVPQDIAQLVDEREKARAIKNFARADELREMLKSKGWVVEDTDYGPRIKHA